MLWPARFVKHRLVLLDAHSTKSLHAAQVVYSVHSRSLADPLIIDDRRLAESKISPTSILDELRASALLFSSDM